MLKRGKILLGLVMEAPQALSKTHLVKLAFLVGREEGLPPNTSFYDFLPYKYGPFSFTLYRDLEKLEHAGLLQNKPLTLNPSASNKVKRAFLSLEPNCRKSVHNIIARYGHLSRSALVQHVYKQYPWYASRSELARKPPARADKSAAVYTVGYEGESIDGFLDKLLRAGIKRLIDVRHNPVSRKYGFAKKTLARLCGYLDIEYMHMPELGIPPSYRKTLETFEDYQILLRKYDRSILPKVPAAVTRVSQLVKEHPSALLCVEADIRCCHRSRLARRVSSETGLPVVHL